MKYYVLLALLSFTTRIFAQGLTLPNWFTRAYKQHHFEAYYILVNNIKPAILQADFNGDGIKDIAAWIEEKGTRRKGVLIIHGGSYAAYVFGAGNNNTDGGINFKWADKWLVYKHKEAFETIFQKDGDIKGSKKVNLFRPGIYISEMQEGTEGSGGIIYWNGNKYIWIHQGE